MDPITGTLGLISAGISLASGISGIFSSAKANSYTNQASIYNSLAIKQKAEAEAQANEYNAAIAAKNAVYNQFEGEQALAEQQRNAYRSEGAAKAAYGASGVSSASGSAQDVLADSAASSIRDFYNLKFTYDMQTQNYKDQQNLYNMAAGNARAAAVLGLYANSTNTSAQIMNNNSNTINSIGSFATGASRLMPQFQSWYSAGKTQGWF